MPRVQRIHDQREGARQVFLRVEISGVQDVFAHIGHDRFWDRSPLRLQGNS
jgi:hypothetical protein